MCVSHLECVDEVVLAEDVVLLQGDLLAVFTVQQRVQLDHVVLHVTHAALDLVRLTPLTVNLRWYTY